jgi:hypothetical protein
MSLHLCSDRGDDEAPLKKHAVTQHNAPDTQALPLASASGAQQTLTDREPELNAALQRLGTCASSGPASGRSLVVHQTLTAELIALCVV